MDTHPNPHARVAQAHAGCDVGARFIGAAVMLRLVHAHELAALDGAHAA